MVTGSLFLSSIQAQDYYQGSLKIELTASGPQLVFLIKLTGANSRTEGFVDLEFNITYPNTRTMTFGTPINNTAHFPTLAIAYGGINVFGIIPGKTYNWWYYSNFTGTNLSTYNVGQEYEVFRVPITSSADDFVDLSLEYDGANYYTYLAIVNHNWEWLTTADLVIGVPVYYGPGTYTGDYGNGVTAGGSCAYTIFDQQLVLIVPVLVPVSLWALSIGFLLILVFTIYRFKKS